MDEVNNPYSMELCGGTHIKMTGDIGFFKIISESSVGAGVRRIEAVVGSAAEGYVLGQEAQLHKTAQVLNTSKDEIFEKVQKLLTDIKTLQGEIGGFKSQQVLQDIDSYIGGVKDIDGIKFLPLYVKDADVKSLRDLSDKIKVKLGSAIILLASQSQDKSSFIVSVTDDYVKQGFNAGAIAKNFAQKINGSGGGKPDFAQGGTKTPNLVEPTLKTFTP
jgi:alanyl-tRNA synthetase